MKERKNLFDVDPLEDLGEIYFVLPGENTDFTRGIDRGLYTRLKSRYTSSYNGIQADIIEIMIGQDYRGVKLPEDTEAVRFYNLNDGRQVIEYLHWAPLFVKREFEDIWDFKDDFFLKPFTNEFRAVGNTFTIESFIRKNSNSK